MNTKKFRTRSEIVAKDNGRIEGVWDTSIDVGYSGVKIFAPNKYGCFPTYAVRIDNEIQYLSDAPQSSIMYRDNATGQLWLVGELAQEQMMNTSSDDTERSMYGRDRYDKPMFHVAAATGLGISLMENEFGKPLNDRIVVQSGLPESYLSDTDYLKDALAKKYDFALKIGDLPWQDFRFDVSRDDVFVMSQPKGTLYSTCMKNDGIMHPDAGKYTSGSVIIFDPGFNTFDLFIIHKGAVVAGDTTQNLGMKRVFHDTSNVIKQKFGVSIPVPAMQKYLKEGTVKSIDRKTLESREYPFGVYLYESLEKVCNEAIDRMFEAIGGIEQIVDYETLIVTGGTGEAWFNLIKDKLKNVKTLQVIPGNQNDPSLPFIYSNVRGYYYNRHNRLLAQIPAKK